MSTTALPDAPAAHPFVLRHPILTALALSLGTAVALGVARFSYALLLAPMRDDLGWSYLVAGGMNTGNALGYLLGALITPPLMRRHPAHHILIAGAFGTALLTAVPALFTDTPVQLVLRVATGITSAFIFVSGGLLVSRLAALHSQRAGLLLGLYYGGTGIGIALAAPTVPAIIALAAEHGAAHPWQWAWLMLAAMALVASIVMSWPARFIPAPAAHASAQGRWQARSLLFGLLGYLMFWLPRRQISYVNSQMRALKLIVKKRLIFALEAISSSQAHLSFF